MSRKIFILIFIITAVNVSAAVNYDPELEWKTLSNEYFNIHYHQGLEETAKKLSIISQEVHLRLSRKIGWQPWSKTDVVLVDKTDMANGMASYYPQNRVEIYVQPPELDSQLANFSDWLELVFTHEYTHTLNMDTVHWIPKGLRYFPGRFLFPNSFLPIFLIEGNAILNESEGGKFGRNNSTYTDMVMRAEVEAGTFKSISKAAAFPREWPMGAVPYLYGGLFVKYLEERYPPGSIDRFFHENADNVIPYSDNIYPIPYFFNKDAKDVYRRSFASLWDDFADYSKLKYKRQLELISQNPLTHEKIISDGESSSRLPRFSPDGSAVYYVKESRYGKTMLVKTGLSGGESAGLCRVFAPNSLTFTYARGALVSDVAYYNNFSFYYEAYAYNEERVFGDYIRRTEGLRGRYIDSASFADRIVYIQNAASRYSLVLSDSAFSAKETVIRDTPVHLGCSRISRDGSRVAFSVKDAGGETDLVIYSAESRTFVRLMMEGSAELDPAWTHDGGRIVFSSDRSGVYNLYELDFGTKIVSALTNVTGGAFSPDLSPYGELIAYQSYGANGFRIALAQYDVIAGTAFKADMRDIGMDFFTAPDRMEPGYAGVPGGESYSPLASLSPPFILPRVYYTEAYPGRADLSAGFSAGGWDVLYRHYYSASADFNFIQYNLMLDLTYVYSGLFPDLGVSYYDDSIIFGEDGFPWDYSGYNELSRQRERSGALWLDFIFRDVEHAQSLMCAYIYGKTYSDTYITGYLNKQESALGRVRLGYYFGNAGYYTYSISPEHGRELLLVADVYSEYLASDYNYGKLMFTYNEYLPFFFRNNVVVLNARGGMAVNSPWHLAPYYLGRYEKGESGTPLSGDKSLGIRGYAYGTYINNRLIAGSLEYRLPLLQKDAGVLTVPLMFRDLWINFFGDCGQVWYQNESPGFKGHFDGFDYGSFRFSAGIELNILLTLGYRMDLKGTVAWAHGFNEGGEDQIYFKLDTFYEGAFGGRKRNYVPQR